MDVTIAQSIFGDLTFEAKISISPKIREVLAKLGDYSKGLPLTTEQEETLGAYIGLLVRETQTDAFRHGFTAGLHYRPPQMIQDDNKDK